MKTYQCHKRVRAVRIAAIHVTELGDATLIPDDHDDQTPIDAPLAFMQKHAPEKGGYYVVYEDGYTSYSPREAFEAGYTLLSEGDRTNDNEH
jgi:hypothetical protein